VVEKARWLVSVDPGDKKAKVDLSFGLLRYGNTLRAAGDPMAGLRAMDEARQLLEELIAEDPGNARLGQNLAALRFQYGEVYADLREWDRAARYMREAIGTSRGILKGDPRDVISARLVFEALLALPPVLDAAKRRDEAAAAAAELAGYAQSGMFSKSKEPRVRASVASAFAVAAEYLPGERKALAARAEAEWAGMEKEGLLVPVLAAERDGLRKRLTAGRR